MIALRRTWSLRSVRAFSLVELLLAVFILAIGIIGISALFPAGIAQQRQSNDDIMGPIVADNALALLRTRLNPEWFGTMEEFGVGDLMFVNAGAMATHTPTIPGDWEWKRPGFLFSNLSGTTADEQGAIDVFSALVTSKQLSGTVGAALNLTKAASENFDGDGGGATLFAPLYGIPYNRRGFDPLYSPGAPTVVHADSLPLVLISAEERSYPNGVPMAFPTIANPVVGQPKGKRPSFYWDCMFRRFAGRIQVAIFVYRVVDGGGEPREYLVNQGSGTIASTISPLPLMADVGLTPYAPWRYGGIDGVATTLSDNAMVRIPAAAATPTTILPEQSWQSPNQWVLDEYNAIHRVLLGRKTSKDAVVAMTRPIPPYPPIPELFGTTYQSTPQGGTTTGGVGVDPGARFIWFIPTTDPRGFSLTPVYVTVQEL